MNDGQQTPIQEAISLITIAAFLIAVGCYLAAMNNVPLLSPFLFWVATQAYHFFPALSYLRSPQIPMLVSAAAVGGTFWLVGLPFAGIMAAWFNQSQMAGIERQTARLKRTRARIVKRRRDRDGFDVS
jgi:hypothetical protein